MRPRASIRVDLAVADLNATNDDHPIKLSLSLNRDLESKPRGATLRAG